MLAEWSQVKAGSGYRRNISEKERAAERNRRNGSKAKERGERAAYAAKVAALGEMPCPRRVLFTAALAGDKDARWTCQQLFGDGWRAMAKLEIRK